MINPWGADFNEFGDLITTNTVIAHLWHIVPGMKCQSRSVDRDHRYAYGLIQSITDHLHWGGGLWHDSRVTDNRHSVAGGGHAHCGGMIYLGDNWPDEYRGTLFTNNLHGNRINNDRLVPSNSTYVGVHSDDFLFGNDPWFRGLTLKYGPDGGVYVSDWHDLGECHDSDGSHRSSGRMFKVTYGEPEKRKVDLQKLSDLELANLHVHRNEWFVRRARRILHERASSGGDVAGARNRLLKLFDDTTDELQQLRALWTLFVVGYFDEPALVRLLDHPGQHVRRWAIRFLVDRGHPGPAAVEAMANLAGKDASPKVRLALACALQRLKLDRRWALACALTSRDDHVDDPHLPLMIWYGIEPLVTLDQVAALRLASNAKIPLVRRFIARRALDVEEPPMEEVVRTLARSSGDDTRLDFLRGILDAVDERGHSSAPPSWKPLYVQLSASDNPTLRSTAVRLATAFGDQSAIADLRSRVLDEDLAADDRRDAFLTLFKVEDGVSVSILHDLVKKSTPLRPHAIRALTRTNDRSTARILLDRYSELDDSERQDAIGILGTRQVFAEALVTAIENGLVDRQEVSAFALQHLRQFKDPALGKRIAALWKDDLQRLQKSEQIARYRDKMSPEYLKTGNAGAGRLVFEHTCARCHVLFGNGNDVGPDLTGSGRKDIDYVLNNLVDPNTIIDPAFRLTTVLTTEGQLFNGFMILQDDQFVEIRTQETRLRLGMNDVIDISTTSTSMMPEGMLATFSDEQVRDLLLYLASPRQVELPREGR
jgi:putative heme-binding domain-containing protein